MKLLSKIRVKDSKSYFSIFLNPFYYFSYLKVLDSHSDMVSGGSVSADFDGFYAIIGEKSQFPMTETNSVLLRPGFENLVSMSALKVESSETLKNVDIQKRNCLFPKEMKMRVHLNYTQNNCRLECQLNFALSQVSNDFSF